MSGMTAGTSIADAANANDSGSGDELARTASYDATQLLLTWVKKGPVLRCWGLKLAKRGGVTRARGAFARIVSV